MESLQQRRWYRKLCTFFKILKEKSPEYLFNIIPTRNNVHRTRNSHNIPHLNLKHSFFKNSFFPATIIEWNKLDSNICSLDSYNVFKKRILKFIRPSPNSVFESHNSKRIKLLSRIRLELSHLREHKFKHSFQDTLNPICICGKDIETPCHYLLACPNYDVERSTLLNNLRQIAPNILNYNNSQITQVLLYGDTSFKNETNTNILKSTISYLLATKRFDKPIFED